MTETHVKRVNWTAIITLVLALIVQTGSAVWYAAKLSAQVDRNTQAIDRMVDLRDRLSRLEATVNSNNTLMRAMLREQLQAKR